MHPVAETEMERPTKFGNVRLSEFEVTVLPWNPERVISISGTPRHGKLGSWQSLHALP